MANPFLQFDNGRMKTFDFSPWGGLEGFLEASKAGKTSNNRGAALKMLVPWLARANNMTQVAVSNLPFDIVDDKDKVINSSVKWDSKIGGENPKRLINLVAGALCGGTAYVLPTTIGKDKLFEMQYLAPQTITPYIDREGLQYFDRATEQGKTDTLQPDDIIYFWLPDSDVEIGPAKTHPLGTASAAASLLLSMGNTLQTYGERGFVPATILGVETMPLEAQRKEAEVWWNRFLRGWDKITARIFNLKGMTVQRVGAGLEELKGVYNEITRQSIEDIGAAYGIPSGLFMSDKAYATEMEALIRMWYSSSQFTNIYQTIEETFTEQLYKPLYGQRMVFKPETIDAFQTDEKTRADTFQVYISAKLKPSIAGQIAGVQLPTDITWEQIDQESEEAKQEEKEQKQEQVEAMADKKDETRLNADMIKDLDLWRQMSVRFFNNKKALPIDFECKALPEYMAKEIRSKLEFAKTEDEILKAFEIGSTKDAALWAVADALNKIAERV